MDFGKQANLWQDAKAEYRTAKSSRFGQKVHGVDWQGSGADYHYRNERDFFSLLETARHYFRNDIVVGQGIRRLVANVVQGGFTPDPDTGNDDLNKRLKELWVGWSSEPDACHSEGEFTFQQLEALALQSVLVDGDILMFPLKSGTIQPVEAHRLRTPRNTKKRVVHGILLSATGRRLQYWVSKEDLGTQYRRLDRVSDVTKYSARSEMGRRQILHLYMPDRVSQRRGVSALAPTMEYIGQHEDLQFATLVKAQMAAHIAIIREISAGAPNPITGNSLADVQNLPPIDQGCGYSGIDGLAAGLEITGNPGESIKGFAPNIPGDSHFKHSMLLLQMIAVNLDMPVQMLLLDPSNTNFSGWRGAIDQARFRFRQMQSWFKQAFHRPVYNWKVRNWIESDPIASRLAARSGVSPFHHKWNIPGFPYIEPLKDAQADDLQVSRFLNSFRRVQSNRGRDWEEIAMEIPQDLGMLVRAAVNETRAINEEMPEAELTWRELLSIAGDFQAVASETPETPEPAGLIE